MGKQGTSASHAVQTGGHHRSCTLSPLGCETDRKRTPADHQITGHQGGLALWEGTPTRADAAGLLLVTRLASFMCSLRYQAGARSEHLPSTAATHLPPSCQPKCLGKSGSGPRSLCLLDVGRWGISGTNYRVSKHRLAVDVSLPDYYRRALRLDSPCQWT
jgi:hypothetical protein